MNLPARRHQTALDSNPFREFEDLSRRISQFYESILDGLPGGTSWSPAVDIEEVEDAYVIEAELPGVKRDDIEVELREQELTITGELKERERAGVLRRRTRRTGRFDYRVSLPGDADSEHVDASLRDGVLTVRVAKSSEAQPRRISITAG